MKLPYKPRWLNRLVAWMLGYFWLPCPLCGKNFGGHEWGDTSLMISWSEGQGVCPMCVEEAKRRNIRFINQNVGQFVITGKEMTEEQARKMKKAWEDYYTGPTKGMRCYDRD